MKRMIYGIILLGVISMAVSSVLEQQVKALSVYTAPRDPLAYQCPVVDNMPNKTCTGPRDTNCSMPRQPGLIPLVIALVIVVALAKRNHKLRHSNEDSLMAEYSPCEAWTKGSDYQHQCCQPTKSSRGNHPDCGRHGKGVRF